MILPRVLGSASESTSGCGEEGIVENAATKLFSEKGYAQTTMSDIARASGLQQSSLYYWFRNKEQLLQETLLVNRAPLKFIAEVGAGSGSPAVKLYRRAWQSRGVPPNAPIDFNEIQRIAHNQRTEFHQFWTDYERLKDWVVDLIGAAISEGKFIPPAHGWGRPRRRGDPCWRARRDHRCSRAAQTPE